MQRDLAIKISKSKHHNVEHLQTSLRKPCSDSQPPLRIHVFLLKCVYSRGDKNESCVFGRRGAIGVHKRTGPVPSTVRYESVFGPLLRPEGN